MKTVNWNKCEGDVWCPLQKLKLSTITEEEGVYVIWYGDDSPYVVYVGKGIFRQRFSVHRNDADILSHAIFGTLYVTWASVSDIQQNGVEQYLTEQYSPLEGDHTYTGRLIPVNLPF